LRLRKSFGTSSRARRPPSANVAGPRRLGRGRLLPSGLPRGPRLTWAALASQGGGELEASVRFEAPGEAWAAGACLAAVAIDRETGEPTIERLVFVDDAGVVVNPMLVEGQLLGGLAQGLGEALRERIVYDESGQLVTGSFMDYQIPRATDIPPVVIAKHPTPSVMNPLGAKGVGEAGCIGIPAAIVNAVVDALSPFGVTHLDMPLTSATIWAAMRGAGKRSTDNGDDR
jgi:carbon-monoxide dehydrogenase large subunit